MSENNNRDPREIEMLARVNGEPVTDAIRQGIEQLQLQRAAADAERAAAAARADEEDHTAILRPGARIRPDVGVAQARTLAERLYGIVAADVKELLSYDDRNFLIRPDR